MVKLRQVDEYRWEIPREGKMRTRGLVFASKAMIPKIMEDKSLEQVANVATLPGIVGPSMAMPDIHWGYGFPIGGVAAFDLEEGVVSPGGVGYDINCGVRLLRTNLQRGEVTGCIEELVNTLFGNIPSGVGSRRKDLKLSLPTLKEVMRQGAGWAVKNGFGSQQDLDHIEAHGKIDGADPEHVSQFAMDRGKDQLGTLGSGNHFVEVGYVLEIFDEKLAAALGLFKDQVTAIVHTGSRGLGHQVCDDYIKVMLKAAAKYAAGRKGGELAPLAVTGSRLRAITYASPVASAQIKSALLLAALFAEGTTRITEPRLSRDHTERLFQYFGIGLRRKGPLCWSTDGRRLGGMQRHDWPSRAISPLRVFHRGRHNCPWFGCDDSTGGDQSYQDGLVGRDDENGRGYSIAQSA